MSLLPLAPTIMDIEPLPPQLHLAAALHLLSAVALHGMSPTKTAAVVAHLRLIQESEELDSVLRQTIRHVIAAWSAESTSAVDACGSYAVRPGQLCH